MLLHLPVRTTTPSLTALPKVPPGEEASATIQRHWRPGRKTSRQAVRWDWLPQWGLNSSPRSNIGSSSNWGNSTTRPRVGSGHRLKYGTGAGHCFVTGATDAYLCTTTAYSRTILPGDSVARSGCEILSSPALILSMLTMIPFIWRQSATSGKSGKSGKQLSNKQKWTPIHCRSRVGSLPTDQRAPGDGVSGIFRSSTSGAVVRAQGLFALIGLPLLSHYTTLLLPCRA